MIRSSVVASPFFVRRVWRSRVQTWLVIDRATGEQVASFTGWEGRDWAMERATSLTRERVRANQCAWRGAVLATVEAKRVEPAQRQLFNLSNAYGDAAPVWEGAVS